MSLREYGLVVLARWRWAVGTLVAVLLVVGAAVATVPRTYTAHAEVFFSVALRATPRELNNTFPYAEGLARSYARVAQLPIVLGPVKERLGLQMSLDELASEVTVEAPIDSVLVDIQVDDPKARQAADIGNAVAGRLAVVVEQLSPASIPRRAPFNLTTVQPAAVPTFPSAPRSVLSLLLALVFGALAGVVVAIAVDSHDSRVGRVGAVPGLSELVVGSVTRRRSPWMGRSPSRDPDIDDAARLLPVFERWRTAESLQLVGVTAPDDGGSAAQLVARVAELLARAGIDVLVLDGESTRASVGQVGMSEILARARAQHDSVLVAVPSLCRSAEGIELARQLDAVVVVVEPRRTRSARLAAELEALRIIGVRVPGVVVMRRAHRSARPVPARSGQWSPLLPR